MPQQDPFAIPGMDTPGIGGYSSKAPQLDQPSLKVEDYGYLQPGAQMQIPLTHSQSVQGILSALAQFAGTLGGDESVVKTAQALWRQNEQQRQVAHQTEMLAQIGRAKLEEERKQALAKAQMDLVGKTAELAARSKLDPVQLTESAGALGTDQFPQEYGQAFPPGQIDFSQMQGAIEEQQGLGKERATAASYPAELDRDRQKLELAAKEGLEADQARAAFDAQQAGSETAARAKAEVETKHGMLPQIEAITQAQTQKPQPKEGALNPVVDRLEKEMRRLDYNASKAGSGAADDFEKRVDAIKRELETAEPGSLSVNELRRIVMLVDPGPADWMNSPTAEGGKEWQAKKTVLIKELSELIKKHAGSVVE